MHIAPTKKADQIGVAAANTTEWVLDKAIQSNRRGRVHR